MNLYELGAPGTRSPLSWEELHRRVDEYWATHERDGEPKAPPVVYGLQCRRMLHTRCSGRAKGADCTCWCHR